MAVCISSPVRSKNPVLMNATREDAAAMHALRLIPKVDSAVKALREGVRRVHFIDGRVPHALLLEVFTDKGIGTEIVHG